MCYGRSPVDVKLLPLGGSWRLLGRISKTGDSIHMVRATDWKYWCSTLPLYWMTCICDIRVYLLKYGNLFCRRRSASRLLNHHSSFPTFEPLAFEARCLTDLGTFLADCLWQILHTWAIPLCFKEECGPLRDPRSANCAPSVERSSASIWSWIDNNLIQTQSNSRISLVRPWNIIHGVLTSWCEEIVTAPHRGALLCAGHAQTDSRYSKFL
jgi:hypothetical protein